MTKAATVKVMESEVLLLLLKVVLMVKPLGPEILRVSLIETQICRFVYKEVVCNFFFFFANNL